MSPNDFSLILVNYKRKTLHPPSFFPEWAQQNYLEFFPSQTPLAHFLIIIADGKIKFCQKRKSKYKNISTIVYLIIDKQTNFVSLFFSPFIKMGQYLFTLISYKQFDILHTVHFSTFIFFCFFKKRLFCCPSFPCKTGQ